MFNCLSSFTDTLTNKGCAANECSSRSRSLDDLYYSTSGSSRVSNSVNRCTTFGSYDRAFCKSRDFSSNGSAQFDSTYG